MLLTSTCIQTLYFLQTSEMAMSGSKAPYTVVPAVALTKKGTKPCKGTNTKRMISHTGKNKSICGIYSCVINAYLLFGFHYSPLKVSWNHFTTAKEKQDFVAVVAEILQ